MSASAVVSAASADQDPATISTPDNGPDRADLFTRLGLYGLSSIQVPVLASLASETPLLLTGSHGCGKSLLLERIAVALGLDWRHYNASLLNFDDLVGYPLPDEHGQLRYVQTPASVWGAEAVFIDEISRARVDIQNRLFPIIHEKRVQGIALERLRFRWAALNPPPADGEADYAGSEPLDVALADRFAFHVAVPEWLSFPEAVREQVVRAGGVAADADAGAELQRILLETRLRQPLVEARWGAALARYVRIAAGNLAGAGLHWSARRAGYIYRNALVVHAVREALDPKAKIADSVWLAVLHSQPFLAAGIPFDARKLLAVHKEAWRLAEARADDPLGLILGEPDPARRAQLAVLTPGLRKSDVTTVVTDALAALGPGGAHALAVWLVEGEHLLRLSAVGIDTVGTWYNQVATTQTISETVRPHSTRHAVWLRLKERLAKLDPAEDAIANLLVGRFSADQRISSEQLATCEHHYREVSARLQGGAA